MSANAENAGLRNASQLQWEPLSLAYLDAFQDLVERCDAHGSTPREFSSSKISSKKLVEEDLQGFIGINEAGEVRAGTLLSLTDVEKGTCFSRSYVHPQEHAKDLWTDLLRWQVKESKALVRSVSKVKRGSLEVHVHPHQPGLEEVLRLKGLSWVNSTLQLRRSLAELPEVPELGPYVRVESWSEEYDELARRLFNVLLLHDPDYASVSREQWQTQWSRIDPEWSYVAVGTKGDRPELVGFLMASQDRREGSPESVTAEGAIEVLAISDGDASTELFRALAIESMAAQRGAGVEFTSVVVEEPGDPLTTRLYEGLGFAKNYEVRAYTLNL